MNVQSSTAVQLSLNKRSFLAFRLFPIVVHVIFQGNLFLLFKYIMRVEKKKKIRRLSSRVKSRDVQWENKSYKQTASGRSSCHARRERKSEIISKIMQINHYGKKGERLGLPPSFLITVVFSVSLTQKKINNICK